MKFETGHLYHVYNQGNNHEKTFFTNANYLFFLKKIRQYIIPFADIIAYCLMPNHFHLMLKVNHLSHSTAYLNKNNKARNTGNKQRNLNDSIGIMLRSYTNAINKQEDRSGKLIRERTKAICLTTSEDISPSYYNTLFGTVSYPEIQKKQYPQTCFKYIHNNPVKAGLVNKCTDWPYSSAKDYAGLRHGTLVNKEVAKQYLII